MLRNPTERFISSYYFYFHTIKYISPFFGFHKDGQKMKNFFKLNPLLTFDEYFKLETGENPIFKALERGLYFENISRIKDYFNLKQIHIAVFENLINPETSQSELKLLYKFIAIHDNNYAFPQTHQSNKAFSGPEEWLIKWLNNYYRDDQQKTVLFLNSLGLYTPK